jgi:hypothetical protein
MDRAIVRRCLAMAPLAARVWHVTGAVIARNNPEPRELY